MMKIYKNKGDASLFTTTARSFPFWKCRWKISVNYLDKNVMEKRGGDFAASAAFLDDAYADEARIECGQGGECPRMGRGVLVMFRRSRLAENIHTFDPQRFTCTT